MGDHAYRTGFDDERLARLRTIADVGTPLRAAALDTADERVRLAEVDVLITGWGAPVVDETVLDAAPRLRAILHTAGTVKHLVTPACYERGILVTTAAEANAIPVAEYTLAAVLFAGKRVLQSAALFRHDRTEKVRPDGDKSNYRRTVGIIGYSRIGRRVVDLLRPFDLDVLVADPFADADRVEASGARLVELDDLLRRSEIVSVHAPALPSTRHMLDKERLALIPDGGTVINTARGVIIDTAALEHECSSGRLSAILDVTEPEPLPAGSPLWELPNVLITPHVAGAQDTEIHRLVDTALDELERYATGLPPLHTVTADELPHIA
ncbi:hydroxyacid dehydrogenase [Phytoactinopolyspora halotolerans]|uniref:Hydroxyacid dehydrogenase n=2 Tax=Phytoactinopolyspora halotolerans TaxID=1981512 RepID=A0A6L9SC25_9ACTN|nr:hydroxyacid dehydrogenase [Phytoactinopolyspora halotolerans]